MAQISPGEIIGRAFQIYKDQAITLLVAAALIYLLQLILALVLPDLFFIASIAVLLLSVFYEGMVVNLVRDVQDGRRDYSMGELFSAVAPVALPLIGLAIVAGIAIAIGFILLIVPGLILLTIWAVAAPVMVIEHPGVFASLGRSRDLVRGNGWPVFGTIVLVFLINIAVNIVAGLIGLAIGDPGTAVLSWLASTVTAPIIALTSAVLYFALLRPTASAPDHPERPEAVTPDPFGGA